jgi:hypothetical protein
MISRLCTNRFTYLCVLFTILIGQPREFANAQEIWLVPHSGNGGTTDFMDLFHDGSPWTIVARQISVFGVSNSMIAHGSDADLSRIFADLSRRHIGLALDLLPLTGPDANTGQCGYHVEGYSAAKEPGVLAHRMKLLGAKPKFYGFDEPLFYGHTYSGQNACHAAIVNIAQDIAEKVKQIKGVFPRVKFGDAEPLMAFPETSWETVLREWLHAYRESTGEPLAFFSIEIDNSADFRNRLTVLLRLLNQEHVPLAVIYNGADGADTDEEWAKGTMLKYNEVEYSARVRPNIVSFQTWVQHPSRILPENDPVSLTGIVRQYIDFKRKNDRKPN